MVDITKSTKICCPQILMKPQYYYMNFAAGDEFTYQEIQTNSFQYTQDKSDPAQSDRLEVTVSDGVHQVTSQIQVSIISVDNSAPVLLSTATCRVLVKEGNYTFVSIHVIQISIIQVNNILY